MPADGAAREGRESGTVYESASSPETHASAVGQGELGMPKILCLGGTHDEQVALRERLGAEFDVVEVASPSRALAELARGDYVGIYADADHFSDVIDVGRFLQNERILQGMPDGVVLLDSDNSILWGNGRLREWAGRESVVGAEFLRRVGQPGNPRPRFLPVPYGLGHRRRPAVRRCDATITAIIASTPSPCSKYATPPQHLIVTIRDVTAEVLQQQKLAAIHQAGIELADLTPDEFSHMTVEERIELLKSNILHYTEDLLQVRRRRNPPARREDRHARAPAGRRHGARSRQPRTLRPSRRATA